MGSINDFSDRELFPLRVFAMEQSGRDPDFICDQDRLGSHARPPPYQAGVSPLSGILAGGKRSVNQNKPKEQTLQGSNRFKHG